MPSIPPTSRPRTGRRLPGLLTGRAPVWILAATALAMAAGGGSFAETYLWVDDQGVAHFSDTPHPDNAASNGSASGGDSPKALAGGVDELRAVWGRDILGDPLSTPPGSSGNEADRTFRLLRGAVEDLRRGETARAGATLRNVLKTHPRTAEAHWYLALLDRQRGRYRSSEAHLRSFLELAGDRHPTWRESAMRRLVALGDEKRLADPNQARGPLQFVKSKSPHFQIELDAELDEVRREYADIALDYLEDARTDVSSRIGVVPAEPLGVVFYGKAAYQRAHQHRFSFQTVGFFDGRIHVSSPAHPSGSLRSLLYHEYAHAIFREQTGGDRPYWLNEGFAERIERLSKNQEATNRSERASLRTRLEAGTWIDLRRIAPSFSGLSDKDARAAYLESVLATAWIEARTTTEQRARLLQRLGSGYSVDQALHEAVGVDTDGLNLALQREILGEFPALMP